MSNRKEMSFRIEDVDQFADAHTYAVNAGAFVRVDKEGITVLESAERIRSLSQGINAILQGQTPPDNFAHEGEEESSSSGDDEGDEGGSVGTDEELAGQVQAPAVENGAPTPNATPVGEGQGQAGTFADGTSDGSVPPS
jgi:hypothetical protein